MIQLHLDQGHTVSEFQKSDRHHMVENLQDGTVQQWTLLIPFPYTLQDADTWLECLEKRKEAHGVATNWAIRNPGGRAIGGIGLHDTANQPHSREIGYWITREYQGRGIMTGAVRAVTAHAFENLGIARITAAIFQGNEPSARVLEKAGFRQEATLLGKYYRKNGQFIDAVLYARVNPSPLDSATRIHPSP